MSRKNLRYTVTSLRDLPPFVAVRLGEASREACPASGPCHSVAVEIRVAVGGKSPFLAEVTVSVPVFH